MNINKIVLNWLIKYKYDGLCNPHKGCNCLNGNLAPCGEIKTDCYAGNIEYLDEDAMCDCDKIGTKHWHICLPPANISEEQLLDACNWRCDCGKFVNPCSADWRWNGSEWEHDHGYPIGHVIAQKI